MRGFRQFDPPVSVVSCFHRELLGNTIAHFDTGAVTCGLFLAAWCKGRGAVITTQAIMQSPVAREGAGIRDGQVILACVARGWPDERYIANLIVFRRRSAENVTRLLGHDN
ncbi:MAG: hypothetical protein ACSHXI_07205 [Hoeflea sp.]|uniref:hypothetical protein n=1 Tax=Hoeflea sp. TaxID=1940281 RepID=UPI003EF14C96